MGDSESAGGKWGLCFPSRSSGLMASTTKGCTPTGGAYQRNAWHSFEAQAGLLDPCGARGDDAIAHETLLPSKEFAEATSCVADFQVSAALLVRGFGRKRKGEVKVRLGMGPWEGGE